MQDMDEEYLSIQTCAKKYNLNTATLRRWIKKGYISAIFEDNQYLIDEASLIEYLNTRGMTGEVAVSNNLAIQLAKLEKENEMLNRLIEQIQKENEILQKENEFLKAQVQQLTNTISMLTTRQLPEPKSFTDRLKGWFKRE
jgi:predicted nuclease with TOPRIM domain